MVQAIVFLPLLGCIIAGLELTHRDTTKHKVRMRHPAGKVESRVELPLLNFLKCYPLDRLGPRAVILDRLRKLHRVFVVVKLGALYRNLDKHPVA